MKRLLSCLLAIATCGLVLLVFAPSSATTSCSIEGSKPTEFRVCGVRTATVGAEFDGFITWYYIDDNAGPKVPPSGRIDGTVYDTSDDGSCAWVRLTHFDTNGNSNYTIKFVKACGKGAHATINDSADIFNSNELTGRYTTGTWKAFLETNSLSIHLWSQSVSQLQP